MNQEAMRNFIRTVKIECNICDGTFAWEARYQHVKSKKHITAMGQEYVRDTKNKEYSTNYYKNNKEKLLEKSKEGSKIHRRIEYCAICDQYYKNEEHLNTKKHHKKAGTLDQIVLVKCQYEGCNKQIHKPYLQKHHKRHEISH